MPTHVYKTQENTMPAGRQESRSVTNATTRKRSYASAFQYTDNRPEAVAQRKLQQMINNSPQAKQLPAMADEYSTQQHSIQKKENKTGLPDNLKAGIENLSGYSMDDVKVHYNSVKPAQLQAYAYAQGTEIHLASGQEKHLAHEAWHVVQQKQGKVKPTMQLKDGVNINDDTRLEREADNMGQKAMSSFGANPLAKQKRISPFVTQRITDEEQQQAIRNIQDFANSPQGNASAPIWHLPNNTTLIGTSHSERLYKLPFRHAIYEILRTPFQHVIVEKDPSHQSRHEELEKYIDCSERYNTLKSNIDNTEGALPRDLKIAKARELPELERYLESFPSLLDDTIVALASSEETQKNELETQSSRNEANERNISDEKNKLEEQHRLKAIKLGKIQSEGYARGEFNRFFSAHAEEQKLGFDHYDIEERNLQWLGKRGNRSELITIPDIFTLPGRKLIIVGASHVPTIMMTLNGNEIREQTAKEQHETDLVRMGSDFQ